MPTGPYFNGMNAAQILAGGYGGGAADGGTRFYTGPDGKRYQLVPEYSTQRIGEGQDATSSNEITGYRLAEVIDGNSGGWLTGGDLERYNGTNFDRYSTDGQQYRGTDQWTDAGGAVGLGQGLATLAAMAIGGNLAQGMMGGAGALEAAPGFTPGAAGGGSFGVLDGSALAAEGFMPSATGGTFGVIDSTVPWGASSASLMGPAATAGATGAATSAAAKGAATGAASGLLGDALKYGLPFAGAIAGSQGSEQSQTTTRDIPDWLKSYYTGQNGLLPQAQGLLSQSMSPESQAQIRAIQQRGLGLLNQPMTPRRG